MAASTPSSGDVIAATEAWQHAAAYLAPDLLDGLGRHGGEGSWIEPLDGTLLMADISGFTRMSERLAEIGKEGAEWLTTTINLYFESMLDAGRRYGGSNLKFGGDALLLSFTGDEHALRAVRAALAMQSENRRFAAVRLEKERIRLKMSIGAHSGRFWSAAAGVAGLRMQHFVLGEDACQVAAAEGVADAGEVVVTPATAGLIGDARTIEKDGMYRVLGMSRGSTAQVTNPSSLQEPGVLSYLPPPVAATLLAPGVADLAIGEHRKTTVIFLHVLGVETLIETDGPDTALQELQEYVSLVVNLAEKYGGFLAGSDIYNEGVKLILVFGAPVAREQDAANALRLSLELRERLPGLNLRLRHRMGVNSGYVFAGDIGTEYRREYTVMGDAVNLAARLMSAATEGQVLASKRTIEEAGATFDASALEPIRVKGKRSPIEIGAVEREVETTSAVRAERGGEMVGRENELAMLREVCREVEEGNARAVALSGEPGIGKSRLTAEFLDYLAMRGWVMHRAQCQSHLSGNPFAPWGTLLSSLLGCGGDASPKQRAAAALEGVRGIEPGLVESAPLLRLVLPLPFEETEATRGLDEEARRRRLFDLVAALIVSAGQATRIALVLEDVHWADTSSRQLLSHVVGALRRQQVMVLATSRTPDVVDPGAEPDRMRRIAMKELSEEEALALVRSVLGMPALNREIAAALMTKARGNPLFLAEVTRSLRESGELDRLTSLPESHLAQELAVLDIPDRVQSLIMSRIDALDSMLKEVLRGASVLGASFDRASVGALLQAELGEGDLGPSMQKLAMADLIEAQGSDRFTFAHALIQDVAYESLLYSRRRKLHERAGSYFEVMHWRDPAPVYDTLVYHYVRAGNKPRSLLYSVLAGDKARTVFANDEAIVHYERAATLSRDAGANRVGGAQPVDVSAPRIQADLADVLELTGSHADAVEHYGRALALLGGPGLARISLAPHRPAPEALATRARQRPNATRKTIANICRKVGSVHERLSDYETALGWFRAGLAVLPRGSALEKARGCIGISGAYFRSGDYAAARPWCLKGLRFAGESGGMAELAHAHDLLGVIYRDAGSARRAISHRTRALEIYRELEDLGGQGDTLNNLGLDHFNLSDWPAAVQRFEECLAIAERTGDLDLQAIARNNLGEVYLAQGNLLSAKTEFRWTIDARQKLGHVAIGALAEANLGQALMLEGQLETARESLESSLSDFRRIKARAFEADVEVRLAALLLANGENQQARAMARKGLRSAEALELGPVEETAHLVLGRIATQQRRWREADAQLHEALRLAQRSGSKYGEARTRAALGALHAVKAQSPRDQDTARAALRQALSVFNHLGASLDARMAEAELETLATTRRMAKS